MSLEIEVKYASSRGQVLQIGWFEGAQRARMVLLGPQGEREEIQINQIGASLSDAVAPVISESSIGAELKPEGSKLVATLKIVYDRRRVGRSVALAGTGSPATQLCAKLVAMSALLARDPAIVRAIAVLRQHL